MGPDVLLSLGGLNGLRRRLRDVLMGQAKLEVAPDGRQFPGSGEATDALLAKIGEVFTDIEFPDITSVLHAKIRCIQSLNKLRQV